MRTTLLLLTMTLALGLAMTAMGIPQASAADKSGKLLRHIVLHKFNRHFPYGLSLEPIQTRSGLDCSNAPPPGV